MLKKDKSIKIEKKKIWTLSLITFDRSLTGRNPPDDIIENARFNESKDLIDKIFKIIKIKRVNEEYSKKIFIACLNISELLKEIKLVNVFLKLSSYISIKKIIENKKYNPPIHCVEDLHRIKLWSICLILTNTVNPVEVNPDIASKKEFKKVKL